MKDFRNLKVWSRAHQLTIAIYESTSHFPHHELFGLTTQMRRCSASIGANIAEGCGKRGNNEFQRFLYIASGSASELDYHMLLAHDLKFLSDPEYSGLSSQLIELRTMLTSLLQKVEQERLATKDQLRIAKC